MSPPVVQKALAHTGVTFSQLSLGTVKFGRNKSVKYPTVYDLPSDAELSGLLAQAIHAGISTLDTAPAYGLSEERLGKLLNNQRQNWQIISKAGENYDAISDSSHYDYSPRALAKNLENSLKLLRTDYLDCWMLHCDGNDLANLNDEVLTTLDKARERGHVRSIGASTKTVEGGRYALQHLDCVMTTASLDKPIAQELLSDATRLNKSLLLKKIYDSGWALTSGNKESIMRNTLYDLFSHPAVCSAVIATTSPLHLLENISALIGKEDAENA
jgi:aryl-alcohol dehydrogenase-like predicted oxidoreductase